MPIYTSLLSSNDIPTGPILQWFHGVLTGLHAQFLHMVKYMCKMDNWGIVADLLCYQEYDEEYQKIHAKIHRLQLDASTVEQDHALCEQRLEALRCTEGLTHLKGLGPKSTHAKWGTCFMDNEDKEDHPRLNHQGC
jgi:hypothetical protein